MDPSTGVNAFGSGSVDAAAICYPLIDKHQKAVCPTSSRLPGPRTSIPG